MKAAYLSLAMVSLTLLQVEALACHPKIPPSGRNTPRPKVPPLAITQTGVPPFVVRIDPTTGQRLLVPNPLFPSHGMRQTPGNRLLPTSNVVLNQAQMLTPTHNMMVGSPAAAYPTHGTVPYLPDTGLIVTHGMPPYTPAIGLNATHGSMPGDASVYAQPTHGAVAVNTSNAPQPLQLVSTQAGSGSPQTASQDETANETAQLWTQMSTASTATLKQALLSPDPLYRVLAAQMIGIRKLPCQEELIKLLSDSNPYVRQAARQSLVQLSESANKKADFGPAPGASESETKEAAASWKNYWQTVSVPKG